MIDLTPHDAEDAAQCIPSLAAVLIVAALWAVGCEPAGPGAWYPANTSVHYLHPPSTVLSAAISVLQMEGYVITQADSGLGFVSGTQSAQVDLFAGALVGAEGMTKNVTVRVTPSADGGSDVLATFNIALINKFGGAEALGPESATTSQNRARFYSALNAALGSHPTPPTHMPSLTEHDRNELGRMCDTGDHEKCALLGLTLFEGHGVAKDLRRAIPLLWKACDGGYLKACTLLGVAYRVGHEGMQRDVDRGTELLRKACNGGDATACRHLSK